MLACVPTVPSPPAGWPAGVNPFAPQAGDSANTLSGIGIAQAGYQSGLAGVAASEGQLKRGYGVVEDPTGSIVDPASGRRFRVDVKGNPYSLAANVAREWTARRKGSLNQAAQTGTLYDGSYGRSVQRNQRGEGQANFDMWNRFADAMTGLGQQRLGLFTDAANTVLGLRGQDADRVAMQIPAAPHPVYGLGTPIGAGGPTGPSGSNPWVAARNRQAKPRRRGRRRRR